jgi:transposase
VIHLLKVFQKEDSMGKPYSNDLRERIVGAVEGGQTRRGAARQFAVSPSCAIKLLRRWQATGSVAPDRQGAPKRYKLDPHAAWLLGLVAAEPDITLEEIRARLGEERDMTACIGTIWNFFDRHGISFKKNRARG